MRLKIVTGVKSFSKPEQPQPKKSKFLSAQLILQLFLSEPIFIFSSFKCRFLSVIVVLNHNLLHKLLKGILYQTTV